MNQFSHIDKDGNANMVNVGDKTIQKRKAKATGCIKLQIETIKLIKENQIKKGDVLTVAEISGIQAAKQTWQLIPLCHQIALSKVDVKCVVEEDGVRVSSEAYCNGQTGVEMEALTAVNIALLTIYDMCKAIDKQMKLSEITLIEKTKE